MGVVVGVMLVERAAAPVHTANGVANERVQSGAESLIVALVLAKGKVLACADGLTSRKIGVHTFPTAWKGTSVENHQ